MARITALSPVILCAGLGFGLAVGPLRRPGARPEVAPRYVFVPVEKGALRLNTTTGEVSLCSGANGAGACAPVPDGEHGGGEATRALQDRVAALEARIAALEADDPSAEARRDEETLDRVMVLTERMMRRFFGIVRDMREDFESGSL
jgi:hypothetical protein